MSNRSSNWFIAILCTLIICLVLLIIFRRNIAAVGSYSKPLDTCTYEEQVEYVQKHVNTIDVTVRGETHEYLYSGGDGNYFRLGGHWAGCKYCK